MKKVYLILGEWHVGKSTLVRALTGVSRASRVKIRFTSGNDVELYAWMRSMQEESPSMMSPQELLNDITSPNEAQFEYYLIPIRITGINGYPDGQDYINLINAHCSILGAVVLSQDLLCPTLVLPIPQINIPNSISIPPNGIANIVRTAWSWQ